MSSPGAPRRGGGLPVSKPGLNADTRDRAHFIRTGGGARRRHRDGSSHLGPALAGSCEDVQLVIFGATQEDRVREHQQFIAGEWVSPAALFDDYDPYRGTVMARVPAGTRADAARAVDAAAAAFPGWAGGDRGVACAGDWLRGRVRRRPGAHRDAAAAAGGDLGIPAGRRGNPLGHAGDVSRWRSASHSGLSRGFRRGTARTYWRGARW